MNDTSVLETTTTARARPSVLPWVLLVIAVAFAGVTTAAWQRAEGERSELAAVQSDRDQVVLRAQAFLVELVNWEGRTLDQTISTLESMGTDNLRESAASVLGLNIDQQLRDLNVRSVGQIQDVFIQQLENGRAGVFAIVRQEVESDALEQPTVAFNYFDMRVIRLDGEWLIDEVVLTAPPPGPPPLLTQDPS